MSNIMMYTRGAKDTLENVEKYLTESINRHDGVRTSEQAVKVLNDVIYYLHKELSSIPDVDHETDEDELLEMTLQGIFGTDVQFMILKGDK